MQILRAVTPWAVHYDHRAYVRIASLASDILESVPKYLERFQTDKSACVRFRELAIRTAIFFSAREDRDRGRAH
jgi:hypothetical protein